MFVCVNSRQPWNSPIPTLVHLQNCKTRNDVNQIHSRMLTTGLIKDKYFTTKLILTLCSSPHKPLIEFSRYIFFSQYVHLNQRSDDDLFLWNAIIKSFSHGHDPKSAFDVFCLMLENGVYVDKYSCSLVLKGCASIGLLREGMQIHCLMKKLGIGSYVFLENCLICFYLRCGCVGCARQMFDRMVKRDCVSFNSMIDGYVKFGMFDLAHALFDSMPMEDRNSISWNTMISGYVQSLDGFLVALELFGKMPKKDVVSWNLIIGGCVKRGKMEDAYDMFRKMPVKDGVSWANMIYGYAKIGKVDVARSFFDEMPERDVIACNVMLTGYVQNAYCTEALQLFQYMQSGLGLLPDSATLSIVLSAIAQVGYIDDGVDIHHYIEEQRLSLGGKLGAALIDMYAKCGSIENAMLVFESIEDKDVNHWNAVIGGLAIHGLGEMAFELFMEMESLLVKPDDITFIGVLSACGHAGLLKEGLMCFEIMRRVHKMEPRVQHYGCLVDILGRAGHIEEAKRYIEEMPIEPNDIIWRTLLSACKNHNNIKVGEPLAKQLIKLDSGSSSPYVLLSHMYAGLGMWNDAKRLRTIMKERDLKKFPGFSWIELDGTVHAFFVGDKSHHQEGESSTLEDLPQHNPAAVCS